MPKKLPKGISNYETIMDNNYYYVDKTMYIEKLENYSNRNIMLLRPRKFGKSLFISTLNYYYDILEKDKFEKLFGNTYIGKNPTNLRNSYYILKFNFSGIDTSNNETTISGFKREVSTSIDVFVAKYGLDFYVNNNQEAEDILDALLKSFSVQRPNDKLYVLIDEYDHFANELLGFNTENFKNLVSRQGKVRKWYEILKKGTETVVERIFITGVAPITLDSLTSGFNVADDLTRDRDFNEIFGFTEKELKDLMNELGLSSDIQSEILPIMKEYYDGYKFSVDANERMYNSNMCLYFLELYIRHGQIPNEKIDVNIASDYEKLSGMINLCNEMGREKIIEDSMVDIPVISGITSKFNPKKEFDRQDLISELFYLGYLTILEREDESLVRFKIPNRVMKDLYADYFLAELKDETNINFKDAELIVKIKNEITNEGKIDTLMEKLGEVLKQLSNRDFRGFKEKDLQIMLITVMHALKGSIETTTEQEVERRYLDVYMKPKIEGKYTVLMEFKYLKKEEEGRLKEKQIEAKKQVEEYKKLEKIRSIEKLKCYTAIVVNDTFYVEEV